MTAVWWACESMEREPDAAVQWHYEGCDVCRFKADVQRIRFPEDETVQRVFNNLFGFGPLGVAS